MGEIFSKTREPMRKDASCINILTCESYIKRVLATVPYDKLFEGVTRNADFAYIDENTGKVIPVNREFLLDSDNWVSNKLLNRVYENTVAILNDPDAIYKAGRNIFQTTIGTHIFMMRLAGVQTIIRRLPRENAKFNRNRSIEIVDNDNGHAVIRLHWDKDPGISKSFCDMNRGVYEGLGRLTNNPATVEEHLCQFEGGAFCEYHIKWKAKPYFSRLLDQLRYWLSREYIEELEKKIAEVNEIRLRQERIIESRTKQLAREKQKVLNASNTLSRYVAPQLVEKILAEEIDDVWGHSRRKLTLFFSDIKDFTPTTDSMEPEDMAELLNEYFSHMNEIINRHGGTLASFIGDALFVFLGAPERTTDRDHALRCVKMAVDMQRKMARLQQKWFQDGIEHPLQIRCGISTGMATVGGFGSKERRDYTAMGMQVNLAARLESACEPGGILISHSTWALVKDRIRCEPKGKIEVKGFSRPVRVYNVLFEAGDDADAAAEDVDLKNRGFDPAAGDP